MVVFSAAIVRQLEVGDPGGAQKGQDGGVEAMDVQAEASHRISGKIRAEFAGHGIGGRGRSGVFNIGTEAKKLFAQMFKVD